MLRLGFFAVARPVARASSAPCFQIRAFSQASRSNVLDALRQQRPTAFARLGLKPFGAGVGARTFMTDTKPVVSQAGQTSWTRYAVTAGTVGLAVIGTNWIMNRETRDGLSAGEQSYLHDTFKYTGGGLVLTAIAARSMFKAGLPYRLMAANPWLVLGVSLVGSIGTMIGAMATSPDKPIQKHLFWAGFNLCQAATLSPLWFLNPALLSRAALYTCGVVGSLSYVGATAKNETYLYMGGPLLAGLTVVCLSSLAPMVMPLGLRGLAVAESISLYGGLAVFGGFVLFDTQKILRNARMAEAGAMVRDPLRDSISLELDMINIFIRMVQILALGGNRRK